MLATLKSHYKKIIKEDKEWKTLVWNQLLTP
jgi:hypothetical protein